MRARAPGARPLSRKAWLWSVQAVAAGLVALFLGRALVRHWGEFRAIDLRLELRPGWLALSTVAVLATYVLQVASWRTVLRGWGQPLALTSAARIWCLANLGRYVPGKVWSVAGLVVLAQRAGVATWAATASTVAVQALGVGTAVALVAAAAPGAVSPLRLGVAAAAALGMLGVLAWPAAVRRLASVIPAAAAWHPLPPSSALRGAALTLAGWVTYGLAFWLLSRGVGVAPGLELRAAAGVFALGYILGLAALFAPGGVLVREAAFVALLTPLVGSGSALALTLASRVQLTLTEAAAALAALAVERSSQGGTR
jgi:uncharacterized membrane protein YbhN (UPF0104 family)